MNCADLNGVLVRVPFLVNVSPGRIDSLHLCLSFRDDLFKDGYDYANYLHHLDPAEKELKQHLLDQILFARGDYRADTYQTLRSGACGRGP